VKLEIGVDWVALSFVQTPADIKEIREIIDAKIPDGEFKPMVMAKIEKPSCFEGNNLEEIVRLCDGIMVARGDLGVECPPEDVPILQKTIIDECRKQGKPVVVATQMLESMIDNPTPTRAEASDVATAIYDGADAIMLSAESAAGKVRSMKEKKTFAFLLYLGTNLTLRLVLYCFVSYSTQRNPWPCNNESSTVSRMIRIIVATWMPENLLPTAHRPMLSLWLLDKSARLSTPRQSLSSLSVVPPFNVPHESALVSPSWRCVPSRKPLVN
jgi:Pyruvate kinase, barrel domain